MSDVSNLINKDLAKKYATKEVDTAKAQILSTVSTAIIGSTIASVPVIGTIVSLLFLTVSYLFDQTSKGLSGVLSYIPDYIDPDKVPTLLAKCKADRDGLFRDIFMDFVAKVSNESDLVPDYEVSSRGGRIAGSLESKCKDSGINGYEIALLMARIYHRFDNGPRETIWQSTAKARLIGYNGWLVNPEWKSSVYGQGGTGINTGKDLGTSPGDSSTMLLAGAGLLVLILALRK